MSVKKIDAYALCRMNGKEGLILQGCGGDLTEWVDGINEMLTEAAILKDKSAFKAEDCSTFEHDGLTCILFPFEEDVKLDMGKLAMWRLRTHEAFGGTWLSDYVPNRLGGFTETTEEQTAEQKKPDCPLIGADSNIFNLMGIAARTLRHNGMADEAKEMSERIYEAGNYDKALGIIGEYVNITSVDEDEDMDDEEDYDEDEGMEMT